MAVKFKNCLNWLLFGVEFQYFVYLKFSFEKAKHFYEFNSKISFTRICQCLRSFAQRARCCFSAFQTIISSLICVSFPRSNKITKRKWNESQQMKSQQKTDPKLNWKMNFVAIELRQNPLVLASRTIHSNAKAAIQRSVMSTNMSHRKLALKLLLPWVPSF